MQTHPFNGFTENCNSQQRPYLYFAEVAGLKLFLMCLLRCKVYMAHVLYIEFNWISFMYCLLISVFQNAHFIRNIYFFSGNDHVCHYQRKKSKNWQYSNHVKSWLLPWSHSPNLWLEFRAYILSSSGQYTKWMNNADKFCRWLEVWRKVRIWMKGYWVKTSKTIANLSPKSSYK